MKYENSLLTRKRFHVKNFYYLTRKKRLEKRDRTSKQWAVGRKSYKL